MVGRRQTKVGNKRKPSAFIRLSVSETSSSEPELPDDICDDESDMSLDLGEDDVVASDRPVSPIQIGKFVLVKFELGKSKSSCVYYVGLVESIDNDVADVKFLRKIGPKFVFPEIEDKATVDKKDIVLVLPDPSSSGGTARSIAGHVKEAEVKHIYPRWVSWFFLILLFILTLLNTILNGWIISTDDMKSYVKCAIAIQNNDADEERKIKDILKVKFNKGFRIFVYALNLFVKVCQILMFVYDDEFNGNPLAVYLSLGLAFGIEILIPENKKRKLHVTTDDMKLYIKCAIAVQNDDADEEGKIKDILKVKVNKSFRNFVYALNLFVKVYQILMFVYDDEFNGNPLAVYLSLGLAFGIEILIPENKKRKLLHVTTDDMKLYIKCAIAVQNDDADEFEQMNDERKY
ncbi:hypothetical protein QYM36_018656 [Artemia franciscana]|uniref:Uncharacterized protein n=1 Tax=Artemia franciscana TaxID=6661 RepID=A0AA88KUJ6_ARTSF|nr:hypothetical protein QYM36_018656 [Artemia franciscana]